MRRIIIILCDTLRAKSLPHYGHKRNTLPELLPVINDDFVVYDRAYAPAPWTVPSHLSLFTGLYPAQVMESKTSFNLNESFITMSELFRDSGYRTTAFSSNELVSKKFGFDRGFDKFCQMWLPDPLEDDVLLDLNANNDIERLIKLSRMIVGRGDKSRLLNGVRQKMYKRIRCNIFKDATFATKKSFKLLINDIKANKEHQSFYFLNIMQTHEKHNAPACMRNIFVKDNHALESYYKDKKFIDHYAVERFSEDLLHYLELMYDQEILYLDREISGAVQFLKDNNLYDETTIILTSDHGEQFGEHGNYTRTFSVFEPVIKIPLYIKWAGRSDNGNKIKNEMVMLHDLYSTFSNQLNHWHPSPDSSVDLNGTDTRSWIVSQFPDMSHDILACRQKRQSFSVKELGLEEESLTAFVLDDGTKIVENGSKVSSYNLGNDPDEDNAQPVSDEQRLCIQKIKDILL